MSTEGKEQYRELCKKEANIPLFAQAWWLDLVCEDGKWNVILTKGKNGVIIGALPYSMFKYRGFKVAKMPSLTPFLKIWLKYPERSSLMVKTSFENKVIGQLIAELPQVAYFSQLYDYELTNWLPFYWKGYKQSVFYSYVIPPSTSDKIFKQLKPDVRNKIRKANKILTIHSTNDVEKFYAVNKKSFERQGIQIPYSKSFLAKIDQALATRKQRKIHLAYDQKGGVHGANYLVWDDQSVYNLALGLDPVFQSSGAVQLLLWEGIKLANSMGKNFDFEGSMIANIEPVFRHFGGNRKSYFQIFRAQNKFFGLLKLLLRK